MNEYNHDARTQSPRLTAARLQLAVGRRGLRPTRTRRPAHPARVFRGYVGVEHHELLAHDNAVGRVVAAVVPVDLAEEFRRIVPVPLPAVKQVLSLYRRSGPTHGLATIHTEASLLFELASGP